MPDPTVGESDWMLRMEKKMDKEQIKMILQTAIVLNEINIEILHFIRKGDDPKKD